MVESETEPTTPAPFWAVVEVMGHSRHIGLVEEVTLAGAKMLRVSTPAIEADTPAESGRWQDAMPAAAVLLSPSSLFRVTPGSESICLQLLRRERPWIYPEFTPRALMRPCDPVAGTAPDEEDFGDDYDPEELGP